MFNFSMNSLDELKMIKDEETQQSFVDLHSIGARIRVLRIHYKISQKGLAEQLGTTRTNVSKWERNLKTPHQEVIFQICKHFNILPQDFYSNITDEEFEENISKNIRLSQEELHIINCCRCINQSTKQQILEFFKIIFK